MKNCNKCGYALDDQQDVCPCCGEVTMSNGENKSESSNIVCPNCNATLEKGIFFCPKCGTRLNDDKDADKNKNRINNAADKIKENEFIRSVKQDVDNSKSIKMIKNKARSTADAVKTTDSGKKKKITLIGIIAVVIIVLLIIVTNIHQCEECNKVYFGKKHTISYWGESENVCKDCYEDFYYWD